MWYDHSLLFLQHQVYMCLCVFILLYGIVVDMYNLCCDWAEDHKVLLFQGLLVSTFFAAICLYKQFLSLEYGSFEIPKRRA